MSVPPEQLGFLQRLGQGFQGGLGKLGGALFPTDPSLDPAAAQQAQRNGIIQLGLGTLAGSQQPGGTLGGALAGGFAQAQQAVAQAGQQAFQRQQANLQRQDRQKQEARLQKQLELEEQGAAAKVREGAAGIAGRISAGIQKYSKDPLAYYSLVSGTPEFQQVAKLYGFDPAEITTPEQVLELGTQLGQLSGIATEPKAVNTQLRPIVGPDGKPLLVREEDAIGKQAYYQPDRRGLAVTLPDGTTISDGPSEIQPGELTKATVNKLQETIVNAQDKLDRLNTTAATYKPEYLQAGGFLRAGLTKAFDKLGADVSDSNRKFFQDYSEFRANAQRDINTTIKELAGSAVTGNELQRTQKEAPNDNDSPLEFEAKLKAQLKFTRRAILRANYALKNGIGTKNIDELSKLIPLEAVDAIYEARANEILDELGGGDDKRAEAIRRANQEFGIAR